MKKKTIAVGATLAAGSVLLVSSALASAASSSGYDLYKTAVKNRINVSSATTEMQMSVQDNGSLLGQVDSVIKTDRSGGTLSSSGTFDVKGAGGEQTSSFYNAGGKLVLKNGSSDVYQVSEVPQQEQSRKMDTAKAHACNPYAEKVVDALVGNIANNITLQKQADGTQQVNLQLSQTQIPALGQAIAGLVLSHAASSSAEQSNSPVENDNQAMATILHSLPKLTDNIKIDQVNWSAIVNSANQLQDQSGKFEITGQDAAGNTHDLQIQLSIKESNLNQTTPDTIDLTGKQVQVIQAPHKNSHE